MRLIDLTGRRFKKLLVLGRGPDRDKRVNWRVCCDCGVEKIIRGQSLRAGDTTSCGCYRMTLSQRLVNHSKVENGCQKWAKYLDRLGYGSVSVGNKTFRAHRIAWEVARGPIPQGLFVLHRCDNRACINVDHLFLGTQADNQKDMVSKGRQARGKYHGSKLHPEKILRGEQHPSAKLTAHQVANIRFKYASGQVSLRFLAVEYGISPGVVHKIVKGTVWREALKRV